MNKTLRNKALSNTSRLIMATLNGENWAAPDGYFATAAPIYDGYRIKKNQRVHEGGNPDLARCLPNCEYVTADLITTDGLGNVVFSSNNDALPLYKVQAIYYDLLMNIYPEAVTKIAADGNKYAPVELHENNTLIAVIMPLRG